MTTAETAQTKRGEFDLPIWQTSDAVRLQFRRVAGVLGAIKGESLVAAVCSTAPGEGVTWVTGMLACAVAESGRRVTIADTNSEPGVCRTLGVVDDGEPLLRPSLAEFNIYQTSAVNLSIVSPRTPRTTSSEAWVAAVNSLRSLAPAVLVDCGSLVKSPKLFHLAAALDGVVLVVEAERERRDTVAAALSTLRAAEIHVLGVVLNKRRRHGPSLIQKHF